jgi:hypothetical protein
MMIFSFAALHSDHMRLRQIMRMKRYLLCHFAFPVLFSLVSSTSPFTTIDTVGAQTHTLVGIIVYSTFCIVVSLSIAWHCWYASRVFTHRHDFFAYVGTRAAITLGCIAEIGFVMLVKGVRSVHVHHYFIAFVISLWCSFDHAISKLLLAGYSGLLVQGIGAYSAADILIGEDRLCWALDNTFDTPFTAIMCNNTALVPPPAPLAAIWRVCMQRSNLPALPPCYGEYYQPAG